MDYPASDVERSREMGRPIRLTFVRLLQIVYEMRRDDIATACKLATEYLGGAVLPALPSSMGARMAARLGDGMSIEGAAAREYLYRWTLALTPSPRNAGVFGVPYPLGL